MFLDHSSYGKLILSPSLRQRTKVYGQKREPTNATTYLMLYGLNGHLGIFLHDKMFSRMQQISTYSKLAHPVIGCRDLILNEPFFTLPTTIILTTAPLWF